METPATTFNLDLDNVTPATTPIGSALPSPASPLRLTERFNTIPWSPEDSFDAMVRSEIEKLDSMGWPSATRKRDSESDKHDEPDDKKQREEGDDFALYWNCPICSHTNPAKNLYCDECETRKSPSTLYYAIYKI